MVSYKYKAQDAKGKIFTDYASANDENELHEKLKEQGLLLIDARETSKTKRSAKRLKYDKVSDFARNLSKLIGAGVTLVRALRIISEDESISEKERNIYSDILRLVRSGMPLSDAMEEQGDTFPSLFINMMRSAETGGNLDATAANMAEYYSKEYKLSQKIKSSMTYPKILTVIIIIVLIIIMGFVLPQFDTLFSQMETLPVATRMLMAISEFVSKRWYVLIFLAAVIYTLARVIASIPFVRLQLDKIKLYLPKIGKLQRIIYTARFARTLSSLYSAGIPIITCLTIAKSTIGNTYIESQFDDMIAKIRSGMSLSEGIASIDGFVKKLPSSVSVGEETGALDSMLLSIADQMDYDSEIAIQQMVALIEPVMIVVMAVLVGFIMIAIIQPIYGSYQAISNQGS